MDRGSVTRPSATAEDLAIADLAASEAQLLDELVITTAMLEAHRRVAHEALHKLADLTRQLDRASLTIMHLRAELRRYTSAGALGRAA